MVYKLELFTISTFKTYTDRERDEKRIVQEFKRGYNYIYTYPVLYNPVSLAP